MNRKTKLKIGAGLVAAAVGLALYIDHQCFVAREEKITLRSEKLTEPIRITQISDFHSNALKNLDEVLTNIKKFNPDFIILTGDILDYGTEPKIERSMYFLRKLNTLGIKTYYITGNHEEAGPMLDEFIEQVTGLGINYLANEGESLNIRGQKVYIYGTTMFTLSYDSYKPADDSLNIVLSHFSKNVRENYKDSIDFIFSGHTHGGQVRLPIIGGLIAPGEGILPDYDKGVYEFENSIIYVDSGLGNTFIPLRFLDQIQYTNITLAPVV